MMPTMMVLAVGGWVCFVVALIGWVLQTQQAAWWRDRAHEERDRNR